MSPTSPPSCRRGFSDTNLGEERGGERVPPVRAARRPARDLPRCFDARERSHKKARAAMQHKRSAAPPEIEAGMIHEARGGEEERTLETPTGGRAAREEVRGEAVAVGEGVVLLDSSAMRLCVATGDAEGLAPVESVPVSVDTDERVPLLLGVCEAVAVGVRGEDEDGLAPVESVPVGVDRAEGVGELLCVGDCVEVLVTVEETVLAGVCVTEGVPLPLVESDGVFEGVGDGVIDGLAPRDRVALGVIVGVGVGEPVIDGVGAIL